MFKKDCKQRFGTSESIPSTLRRSKLTRVSQENIMYMNALGQPILVLNSLKAAAELLDRRAYMSSDRPRLIVANEILCGNLFTAFTPYGDVLVFISLLKLRDLSFSPPSWRRTRRAAHEMLTKAAVRDYHPIFCKEAIILASSILENPKALEKHIERSSASATMAILYNYPTLKTEHDKTITEIHGFINRASAATVPGANLVELFPWMLYIPERYVLYSLLYVHIAYHDRALDLQDGSARDWSTSGSIQPCSTGFSMPFVMTL